MFLITNRHLIPIIYVMHLLTHPLSIHLIITNDLYTNILYPFGIADENGKFVIDDAYIVAVDSTSTDLLKRDYESVGRVVSLLEKNTAGAVDSDAYSIVETTHTNVEKTHPDVETTHTNVESNHSIVETTHRNVEASNPTTANLSSSSDRLPNSPGFDSLDAVLVVRSVSSELLLPPARFQPIVHTEDPTTNVASATSLPRFADLVEICYIDEGPHEWHTLC